MGQDRRAATRWSGVTLIELLVVLTILGLIFGVAGFAIMGLQAPRESARLRVLRQARAQAIRSGRAVRIMVDPLPPRTAQVPTLSPASAFFLPDGRAIGAGLDPLTGAPTDARP